MKTYYQSLQDVMDVGPEPEPVSVKIIKCTSIVADMMLWLGGERKYITKKLIEGELSRLTRHILYIGKCNDYRISDNFDDLVRKHLTRFGECNPQNVTFEIILAEVDYFREQSEDRYNDLLAVTHAVSVCLNDDLNDGVE